MKQKLLTALFIVVMLVGIILIFLNPIQDFWINRMVNDLNQVSADEINRNDALDASFDFNEAQTLSIWDVMNAQLNRKDIIVLGSIVTPTVDMQLPIVKGVGKYSLAVGAGTMKPNQKMGEGNYALASHYFENRKEILFSPLYNTNIGDVIYITDKEYVYAYTITKKEVIKATDVEIIDDVPGKTLLTLITCANDGVDRLAVIAEFKEKLPFDAMKDELF